MNHDDNNPDLQTFIDPELEARLVAAVLGEASAFEAAELDRLAAEKPELAIFKRRIEAVHGLVGLAVRPEQAPLRLAPERRAKILQTIGATPARVPSGATNVPVLVQLAEARRKRRKKWIWASSMAASLTLAAILATSSFEMRRMSRPSPDQTVLSPAPSAGLAVSDQSEMETRRAAERDAITMRSVVEQRAYADESIAMKRKSDLGSGLLESARQESIAAVRPSVAAGAGAAKQTPAWSASANKSATFGTARPGGDKGDFNAPADLAYARGQTLGVVAPRAEAGPQNSLTPKTVIAADGFGAIPESRTNNYALLAGGAEKKEAGATPTQGSSSPLLKDQAVTAEEIVVMAPHTVEAGRDGGYYAANTTAGSRMTTRTPTSNDDTDVVQLSAFSVGRTRATQRRVARAEEAEVADSSALHDTFLFDAKANTEGTAQSAQRRDAAFPQSAAEADARLSQEKAAALAANPPPPAAEAPRGEISAAKEAVSTFSLHVSDVSFRLAQAALARGQTPDPTRIRPEEFYNAFDYGDPAPTVAEKISSRIEQAAHPLLQQRNLVRIAVKVGATGRGATQPLYLTVLLDTSGSMEREDRIASVRSALNVLASLLTANDRVTLIGFSRQPRLLAEQLPGNQAAQLASLAESTPFTGGTNLEEALKLATQLARRHQNAAAQNRIVLITDGAANLGNADPTQLATMIETLRQQGIAFDACGVGTDGLDDSVLEALTRKGDGRYYVLDSAADADAGFARQLAGAFRPAAENVKVQVRFNPARVGAYRLIGFEQHRLREEDFRNDKVDAAELAAEEAAVALYQVEVLPQGEGEIGEVFVRFRDAAQNNMVERSWTIRHEPQAKAFDRATPTMQLATTAALLAEKLRGGEAANLIELAELAPVVNSLRGHYANDTRVQELIAMFEQMRRRSGR
jgi:Ca-activated chloride channel family protein